MSITLFVSLLGGLLALGAWLAVRGHGNEHDLSALILIPISTDADEVQR